jgi:hypothetical protein
MDEQVLYTMWWHDLDWCVIAHERVGDEPLVSVQFNSPNTKRSVPKPAPRPTVARERELEVA